MQGSGCSAADTINPPKACTLSPFLGGHAPKHPICGLVLHWVLSFEVYEGTKSPAAPETDARPRL